MGCRVSHPARLSLCCDDIQQPVYAHLLDTAVGRGPDVGQVLVLIVGEEVRGEVLVGEWWTALCVCECVCAYV